MKENLFNQHNPLFSLCTKPSIVSNVKISKKVVPFIVSKQKQKQQSYNKVSGASQWTNKQKQNYSIFICYFRQILKEQNGSRTDWNIFKGMSSYLKTRNPNQCRIYHLKLIKEFRSIGRFIEMVVDRLPTLRQKILGAQSELKQLQIQFNLFLHDNQFQSRPLQSLGNVSLKAQYEQEMNLAHIEQKTEKQEFIKTADSYVQQQNPVKFLNNNNNFSLFSNNSEFKPFETYKNKSSRASLPSFGDDDDDIVQVKQEPKHNEICSSFGNRQFPPGDFDIEKNQTFQAIQMQNPIIDLNPIIINSNQKIVQSTTTEETSEGKYMQKMKEFLECQYLFQLWTSKLQKIMRDS